MRARQCLVFFVDVSSVDDLIACDFFNRLQNIRFACGNQDRDAGLGFFAVLGGEGKKLKSRGEQTQEKK